MGYLPAEQIAVYPSATELLLSMWEGLRPELTRLVRALGIDPARADDVLQEVHLTAWQKCPRNLAEPELKRWLLRVTINRCHLEHRQEGRRRRLFRGLTRVFGRHACNGGASESVGGAEEQELVRRTLRSLDPQSRSILVLRYFAELDSVEIGKILELPDTTVRGRLRAARQKLAEQLRKAGYRHD